MKTRPAHALLFAVLLAALGFGAAAAAAADAAGPPPTPAGAREHAVTTLRQLMASPSPRVARAAATALARTCEKDALDRLARVLAEESSAIAKVAVARTLASCKDARGTGHLATALRGGRRDVRAEAAKMLGELGDGAGLAALVELGVPKMFRVSAGEILARQGHPRGLVQLKAAAADSKATADERLRAAIAMTAAGDKTKLEETRAALDRLDFRPAAAQALARVGDAAARAPLVEGLSWPSLRVASAVALRRLEPQLDVAPLLAPLATAVDRDPEVARASAAEAILVLTGPAADAVRPSDAATCGCSTSSACSPRRTCGRRSSPSSWRSAASASTTACCSARCSAAWCCCSRCRPARSPIASAARCRCSSARCA